MLVHDKFVQRKHNFCCRWTCLYTHIQGLARSQTSWVLQSTLALTNLASSDVDACVEAGRLLVADLYDPKGSAKSVHRDLN
jgi:hypothetical protein